MPSVTTPSAKQVIQQCGLRDYLPLDRGLEEVIQRVIPQAEAQTALAVGETTYDSTALSARQATALQLAVIYRTGALVLTEPMIRKVLGTHEPLDAEDSDSLAGVLNGLTMKAREMEGLVQTGTATRPFARPAVSSSTFTRGTTDRSPSERNRLTDERDDVAADDTANG